jgi:hypothetical protein
VLPISPPPSNHASAAANSLPLQSGLHYWAAESLISSAECMWYTRGWHVQQVALLDTRRQRKYGKRRRRQRVSGNHLMDPMIIYNPPRLPLLGIETKRAGPGFPQDNPQPTTWNDNLCTYLHILSTMRQTPHPVTSRRSRIPTGLVRLCISFLLGPKIGWMSGQTLSKLLYSVV